MVESQEDQTYTEIYIITAKRSDKRLALIPINI